MNKRCFSQAMAATSKLNSMEDKIAMEWYGLKYSELSEDERLEVTYEAHDRM